MEYLEIGRLVNTQGIKGEVRVQPNTDFIDERFKVGNHVFAFPKNGNMEELEIDGVRNHKGFILLHFKGRDSINDVEYLKPAILKIDANQRKTSDLKPGEYFYQQIIGLDVVDESGNQVGVIKDIMDMPANDVWVVDRKDKDDLLLPKIDSVVKKVDIPNHKVIVELMEGME